MLNRRCGKPIAEKSTNSVTPSMEKVQTLTQSEVESGATMNGKLWRYSLFTLATTFVSPAFSTETTYLLNSRFERILPDEDKYTADIRDGFLFLQAKEQQAHGKFQRGTHAKGVCLSGEMEIYDVEKSAPLVSSRLKKGMFSVPGKYPADVRFANAKGEIHPDHDRDVRAVSFSLHMPPELSKSTRAYGLRNE
jgi:hypothetical protein